MTGISGLYQNTKGAKDEAYKDRMKEEYRFVKEKHDKLHKILIKAEAGTLDFEPHTPLYFLFAQRDAMKNYLECLEIRAEFEGVEL